MLDVRRLRILREVAARGSFSGAAAALSYTPSAVAQQIDTLERETRAVLVERSSRGVQLTDAGRVLLSHAEIVLAQLAAAQAELEAVAELRAGTVRLAAFASAWSALVPAAVSAFRASYPDVELELSDAEPPQSIASLLAGDLDLAVIFEPNAAGETHAEIERVHLLDDPLHAVLPRDHPLAERSRLTLGDLAEETWVQPTAACAQLVNDACAEAGFTPRVAFESDDYMAIQGFVATGAGVALVPRLALVAPRADLVVRPLGPAAPKRQVLAAQRANGYRSGAASELLRILRETALTFS